jgi:serine/threonine protein phosphatase PrpC
MLRTAETIAKTHTGRQRPDNEDSMSARPPIFVVADGMGGAQAGEVASKVAVEVFEQGLPDAGSAEERLVLRTREANQQIHELSHAEQERAGMGTTLTAAYVDGDELAIAHVGDSRAYLFRRDELKRLTRDHTLVGALVEQGKLTEEEAAEHPQRSIITRALGPEADVEVDTWRYPLRADDVVLLCSDGLTSMVPDERIAEVLLGAASLEQMADGLIDEANAAGGRDNITVVLFRIEEAGGGGSADEATMVGLAPVAGATAAAAATAAARASTAQPPPAPPPVVPGGRTARRARLARTQGGVPPPAGSRRGRRFAKPVAALLAVVIVLFLVGAGGYLASRQLYFLGTNPQGIVTVYRGLPYELPAGIRLYETFYVSGVPAALVPADRRKSLLNHNLRSQKDASSLIRDLELGKLQ